MDKTREPNRKIVALNVQDDGITTGRGRGRRQGNVVVDISGVDQTGSVADASRLAEDEELVLTQEVLVMFVEVLSMLLLFQTTVCKLLQQIYITNTIFNYTAHKLLHTFNMFRFYFQIKSRACKSQ